MLAKAIVALETSGSASPDGGHSRRNRSPRHGRQAPTTPPIKARPPGGRHKIDHLAPSSSSQSSPVGSVSERLQLAMWGGDRKVDVTDKLRGLIKKNGIMNATGGVL